MAIQSKDIISEQEAITLFNNNVMTQIRNSIHWHSGNIPGQNPSVISSQFDSNNVPNYVGTLSDSDKKIKADKVIQILRDYVANFTRIRYLQYCEYLIASNNATTGASDTQSSVTTDFGTYVTSLQANPPRLTGNQNTPGTAYYAAAGWYGWYGEYGPPFTQADEFKGETFTQKIVKNNLISATDYIEFCSALLSTWNRYKTNKKAIQYSYCHASCKCHSNCHKNGRDKR